MGIDLSLLRSSPRDFVTELTRWKFFRYSFASSVAVVVSLVALVTFNAGLGWSGVRANLASVAIASIPNYTINRYWTWQQDGRNRLWAEIMPFWVMALLGVILSTLAVDVADRQWGTPLAVGIAQLSGFGVLWVAKFIILDKAIWRVMHDLHVDVAPSPKGTNGSEGTTPVSPPHLPSTAETLRPNGTNGNGHSEKTPVPVARSRRNEA